jgi:hypothetical protein
LCYETFIRLAVSQPNASKIFAVQCETAQFFLKKQKFFCLLV